MHFMLKKNKPNHRRAVNKDIKKYLRRKFLIEASENSVICNKCRHVYRTETGKTNVYAPVRCASTTTSDDCSSNKKTFSSPPSVSLALASTAKSHAYCCVCNKPGPKLVVVPTESRTNVFVDKNIPIPPGNRCCPVHLDNDSGMFTWDAVQQLKILKMPS